MIKRKIHFEIDKNIKGNHLKKNTFKNYKNYSPQKSDVIVVIGGDGFMLQTLKKFQSYEKPFYGMNKGTFGFLMNKFKTKNVLNSINRARHVNISALQMQAVTKKKCYKIGHSN